MKILIVDDHPLFRQGLISILEAVGSEVQCLEAASHEAAHEVLAAHPDLEIILLDLQLPDMDGLSLLSELRVAYPQIPIAVVSAMESRDKVAQSIQLGALGFIPKSTPVHILLPALQLILDGGVYLPPSIMLPEAKPQPVTEESEELQQLQALGLTSRPLQVMKLMAQGASNKVIAQALNITENTVKVHMSTVFRVLNVSTRSQAMAVLGRMGINFPLD